MALLDGLGIVAACAQLSTNRPSGRPHKDKEYLDSTTHARYFSKQRLLKFPYADPESNEQTTRTVRGEIEGWIPPGRRGYVKWLVISRTGRHFNSSWKIWSTSSCTLRKMIPT
ncbi:hypothetical protein PR001_g25177 [Phytophthora rubi]|uniref:Uncharacterized protein n=1 Tax=Phytophthora rubi TaxID=129364 RepID=A0A6A3IAZ2_9STRA|nr:hypothetical protein PR002_g25566 [Phytophthora rubi]KAE8977274.1 hypothetical protein PR001_g25177 [Phytophthora rubi]